MREGRSLLFLETSRLFPRQTTVSATTLSPLLPALRRVETVAGSEIDLSKDIDPCPRKQISENSARHPRVIDNLQAAMGSSCSAIADAVLYVYSSERRASPGQINSSRTVNITTGISSWISRLTTPSSSPRWSVRLVFYLT